MTSNNLRPFDLAIAKGRYSVRLMTLSQDEFLAEGYQRSVFVNDSILQEYGWAKNIQRFVIDEAVEPVYDSLGADKISQSNLSIAYTNDYGVKINGTFRESTEAKYAITVNKNVGIIGATHSYSPSHKIQEMQIFYDDCHDCIPTDLHHWSDFAFFAWKEAVGQGMAIDVPQYVTRNNIQNPGTNKVLQDLMKQAGVGEERSLTWPGVQYSSDDGTGGLQAILGTVHGAGVAYLLVDHKVEFGVMMVDQVNVFKSGGRFSLLFRLIRTQPPAPPS